MTRPFANVRVMDFTQVLAGPYGSYQLALLGADVIKVERREGEDMRRTPLSREWADRGMAPSWLAINGNKRSLTLDLQQLAAKEIIRRLAAKADVVRFHRPRRSVSQIIATGIDRMFSSQIAVLTAHGALLPSSHPAHRGIFVERH